MVLQIKAYESIQSSALRSTEVFCQMRYGCTNSSSTHFQSCLNSELSPSFTLAGNMAAQLETTYSSLPYKKAPLCI